MKSIFFILALAISTMAVSLHFNPDGVGASQMIGTGLVLAVAGAFVVTKKGYAYDTITLDQARAAFTNAVVAVYRENVTPTSFLRSFFPSVFSPTKYISFDVMRANEKVAVDILRGTGSNLNKKKRSTIKTLEAPLYAEGFNVNELDSYDTAFGTLDPKFIAQLATEAAETLVAMRNKIERAYEKQCADVLKTGVITLSSGDNIDFKRKSDSLVDLGAGNYWTTNTVDPMTALSTAGQFIREKGKAQGGTYNVIMGEYALNAMLNNTLFKEKYGSLKDVTLGEIHEPQRLATGGTLHGRVSAGSYIFYVWTYPEVYDDANGDSTPYITTTDIIVLPTITNFKTAYSLVPQLPGMNSMVQTEGGSYVMNEYVDFKQRNHVQEILSAGAAVPVAIDTIWTGKVVPS